MIGGPWFERLLVAGIVGALALIAYAAPAAPRSVPSGRKGDGVIERLLVVCIAIALEAIFFGVLQITGVRLAQLF
jgi:hypothetical protein